MEVKLQLQLWLQSIDHSRKNHRRVRILRTIEQRIQYTITHSCSDDVCSQLAASGPQPMSVTVTVLQLETLSVAHVDVSTPPPPHRSGQVGQQDSGVHSLARPVRPQPHRQGSSDGCVMVVQIAWGMPRTVTSRRYTLIHRHLEVPGHRRNRENHRCRPYGYNRSPSCNHHITMTALNLLCTKSTTISPQASRAPNKRQ